MWIVPVPLSSPDILFLACGMVWCGLCGLVWPGLGLGLADGHVIYAGGDQLVRYGLNEIVLVAHPDRCVVSCLAVTSDNKLLIGCGRHLIIDDTTETGWNNRNTVCTGTRYSSSHYNFGYRWTGAEHNGYVAPSKSLVTYHGHQHDITSVCVLLNGKYVTGDAGGYIKIWSPKSDRSPINILAHVGEWNTTGGEKVSKAAAIEQSMIDADYAEALAEAAERAALGRATVAAAVAAVAARVPHPVAAPTTAEPPKWTVRKYAVGVTAVCATSDQRLVSLCASSATIKVWSTDGTAAGQLLLTLSPVSPSTLGVPHQILVLPDGRLCGAVGRRWLVFWSLTTGKQLAVMEHGQASVRGVHSMIIVDDMRVSASASAAH